jgi:hypothetical protein
MGMPGAFDQSNFAFYEEGTESGATIIGTAGAQQSLEVDTIYQCRVQMDEGSTTADDLITPYFQYEVDQSTSWVDITTTSSVIQAVDSTSLTGGDDTTNRLGTTVITPNAWVTEAGDDLATLSYLGDDSCQALLSFQIIGADVSNGQEIRIRLNATEPIPGWTAEADIDVIKAAGEGRRRSNVT